MPLRSGKRREENWKLQGKKILIHRSGRIREVETAGDQDVPVMVLPFFNVSHGSDKMAAQSRSVFQAHHQKDLSGVNAPQEKLVPHVESICWSSGRLLSVLENTIAGANQDKQLLQELMTKVYCMEEKARWNVSIKDEVTTFSLHPLPLHYLYKKNDSAKKC